MVVATCTPQKPREAQAPRPCPASPAQPSSNLVDGVATRCRLSPFRTGDVAFWLRRGSHNSAVTLLRTIDSVAKRCFSGARVQLFALSLPRLRAQGVVTLRGVLASNATPGSYLDLAVTAASFNRREWIRRSNCSSRGQNSDAKAPATSRFGTSPPRLT